ncbi:ABC transporter ATP-binding protein/permease [Bdellovibrio bacteriovorus]|uniref:ABC transporter ATP-binding protein n=1 Tax=Bdellovibrio bacteriovorus TaxID=959 RepID=UPI0021CED832|nr:ABC transporter ATP-binding protein [Bdellovibrio bacteriovorus]UXR64527.1 ABC transporter ATP-binding protein/permease [Bdellovibrio bacteriovorus]
MQTAAENNLLYKRPLWYYIKNNPRAFGLGMLFLLLTNALDGVYPLIMKAAIDQIESQAPLGAIGKTCLIFLAIMSGLAITRYGWRANFGRFHTYAAEHIRQKIFRHITSLGPNFFHKNPVGELMSLLTNDVQSFRQAIGPGLLILADGIIIIAVNLPIMISLNWGWTWKTLVFLPVVPFLIWKVMRLIHLNYKIQQDRFSELTGVAQETVGGIRVIKSFAQEKNRTDLFNGVSAAFEKACNKVARVDSFFIPVMEFGVTSGSVILLFVAKDDLYSGAVTLGTFVAFHRYIQKMVWPMTALGMGFSNFQKGYASFDRIKDVLQTETDIPDQGTINIEKFQTLEFKNVSFKHRDSSVYVLKNVSFTLKAGESLGIMGPVGSGKTTLLHLLTRMYPLEEGQILINGHPIESITQESLHRTFLLVPQEAFLFSESISDNLSFGLTERASDPEIQRMTEIVDLTREIDSLPHKFESQLGERGVNLSGGQKQRLTIARGIIMKTPVLVLDDSLSAVDTRTEKAIEQELRKNHGAMSRIIVAHRLSSLKGVDHILILKEGQVEAWGTFDQVLQQSPTFQKTVQIQGKGDHHE